MKPGAHVTFHALTGHTCGGKNCTCTCDLHVPATVVDVIDDDGKIALVLDVEFPDEILQKGEDGKPVPHEMTDHLGKPMVTTCTVQGFVGRQGCVRQATTKVAESGTWTEAHLTADLVGDAVANDAPALAESLAARVVT